MSEPQKNNVDPWLTILFTLLLVAGLGLTVLGIYLAWHDREFVILAVGWLTLVVPICMYAMMGRERGSATAAAAIPEDHLRLLREISDRLLLSDQAKRITYRQKDRDALRQAIVEDIRIEDYSAAMALVHDMADVYGYREEAEQFRQQILEAQAKKRQTMIRSAIARVDEIIEKRDWHQAHQEIDRLARIYPDYPEIKQLYPRVKQAREKYKMDLLREFRESHERGDHDRAGELLLQLDQYLTPEEARPYMDMARDVLAHKRDNMGVRFKLAVQEHDWRSAVNIGEQIMREFPNTNFASEVKSMLDTLKERAASQPVNVG